MDFILLAYYGNLDNFQVDLEYTLRSHTWAVFLFNDLGLNSFSIRRNDLGLNSLMHWNVEQIGNMHPGLKFSDLCQLMLSIRVKKKEIREYITSVACVLRSNVKV